MVKDFSKFARCFWLEAFTFAFFMVEVLMILACLVFAFAFAVLNAPGKSSITVDRLANTFAVGAVPIEIVWASLWAAFARADGLVPNLIKFAWLGSTDAPASSRIKIQIWVNIIIGIKAIVCFALA